MRVTATLFTAEVLVLWLAESAFESGPGFNLMCLSNFYHGNKPFYNCLKLIAIINKKKEYGKKYCTAWEGMLSQKQLLFTYSVPMKLNLLLAA